MQNREQFLVGLAAIAGTALLPFGDADGQLLPVVDPAMIAEMIKSLASDTIRNHNELIAAETAIDMFVEMKFDHYSLFQAAMPLAMQQFDRVVNSLHINVKIAQAFAKLKKSSDQYLCDHFHGYSCTQHLTAADQKRINDAKAAHALSEAQRQAIKKNFKKISNQADYISKRQMDTAKEQSINMLSMAGEGVNATVQAGMAINHLSKQILHESIKHTVSKNKSKAKMREELQSIEHTTSSLDQMINGSKKPKPSPSPGR